MWLFKAIKKVKILFVLLILFFILPTKVHAFYYHTLIGYKDVSDSYVSNHFVVDTLQTYSDVKVLSAYASITEINKMKKDPNITFVSFDKNISANFPSLSNATEGMYYKNKNSYSLIKLQEAHNSGLTGKNTAVCVIDSGIDTTNDAFNQKVVTVKSFIEEPDGSVNTKDYIGHGTHVSGILVGKSKTGIFTGVAPDAQLYVAKVFNKEQKSSEESLIAAVNWCVSKKTQVINMSLSYLVDYQITSAFQYSLKNAYYSGSIPVAAAGNNGLKDKRSDTIGYPARSPYVLAVASSNYLGEISSFSDRGPSLFMTAPGELIYSAYPFELDTQDSKIGDSQNGYAYLSGTSMATPVVSGVLALAREKYPTLSNARIINIIKSSSMDKGAPGRDHIYGCGIVQAYPIDASLLTKATSPPIFQSYSYSSGTLKINWKGPYDCDLYAYNVYIDSKKANSSFIKIPSITTKNIQYGKPLRIVIQAVDDLGNTSSSAVTIIPPLSRDIPSTIKLYSQTSYVIQQKWMNNFNDSTFRSSNAVTRAESAATLNRVINLSKINSTSNFHDVFKTHWAYTAISKVTNARLMYGSSTGYFAPSKSMTRAETAVLLQRLLKVKTVTTKSPFKDVSNYKQYGYQAIITMNHYGYLKGCSSVYFCPQKSLTRGELAGILKNVGILIKQRN